MKVSEIEQLPEVIQAGSILEALESKGLGEPAIAAGWTRSLLTDGVTADIDVSYVGKIHYQQAQLILKDVLDDVKPANKHMWDVNGIWNAQIAYQVEHTVDNFLLYYLNSIDSVFLASDGKLHDPTGFGFSDAESKTLRINEYDLINREPSASEEVNVCLENCRRLAKFGWFPTARSVERIRAGSTSWSKLSDDEKNYFIDKLKAKYTNSDRLAAQTVYSQYGWGFIFDL